MKKNYQILKMAICFAVLITSSCKKNNDNLSEDKGAYIAPKGYVSQFKGFPKYPYEPIETDVYDKQAIVDIQNKVNRKKQNSVDFIRDSVWIGGGGKTAFYESTEMPAVTEEIRKQVYLGAIVRGDMAGDPKDFVPVALSVEERNPITMYANFPTDSISRTVSILGPSIDKSYIRAALKAGSGEQLQSFSYEMTSYRKFDELKRSFGANVDIGGLFKLNYLDTTVHQRTQTHVMASFTQENFSLNIEPPIYKPFLKDPVNMAKFGGYDPLIVSSVTYGRKGILIMDSDSSYNMVQKTLSLVFTVTIDVKNLLGARPDASVQLGPTLKAELGLRLSKEQKELLQTAHVKMYVLGPDGKSIGAIVKGLEGFADIMSGGGVFSANTYGSPLYYTLNYLGDFKTFRTRFKINTPNN
ncbi:thiol-activated cytolysin family protein [Pedobacter cryoconitis]|uniref:thiol-activated cytolysin family protein n=1 Tax=Pedobacter cryoconitis TaxID=188932 RepID=UPI00161F3BB3|nr:thiol-activated cytolysin family protein [Pedobacter cryoconitis]MBB5647783.1 hypothetical protein [Pedobacter cryoconitis]